MANRPTTWIDSGSEAATRVYDWIAGRRDNASDTASFTPAQVALLKRALQESFTVFAKAVDGRLSEIEAQLHASPNETSNAMEHTSIDAIQGEDATVSKAATNLGEHTRSKNYRRSLRRKRARQKHVIQRSMFLQLRPSVDVLKCFDVPDENLPNKRQKLEIVEDGCGLKQRVASREDAFASLAHSQTICATYWDWSIGVHPWYDGTPANLLARQCAAARVLQGVWRKYAERCKMKEHKHLLVEAQPDSGVVFEQDGAPLEQTGKPLAEPSSDSGVEALDAEEVIASVISRLVPFISGPNGSADLLAASWSSESCDYMFRECFLDLAHRNEMLIEADMASTSFPFLSTRDVAAISVASSMQYKTCSCVI